MKKVYELLRKYYAFSIVILLMGNVSGVLAQPVADAGPDATICENQTYTLSNATASDYDALLWESGGDGTFSDPTALNPIYYPGAGDGNSVDLTLTASANGFSDAVSTMTLTLAQLPEPYAGDDATICGGNDYDITNAAINGGQYNFFSWNAGFDGTFSPDPFTLNPVYEPGALDLLNGEVTINLVVQPKSPCVAIQSDNFVLTFSDEISADAGTDAEICDGDTYQLDGSTTNATSASWATNGDGTFDDNTALDAIYTPGSGDITNGSVTLSLTANNAYCDPDTDDMILTINALPTVNCPADMEVCIDADPFALTGATPAGGTYSGTGVTAGEFDPAAAGAGATPILYTYTDPATGCTNSCTFDITVYALPVVECPGDMEVCEDADQFTLTGATPLDGTYSGDGVEGGDFDPADAGVGTHTITYTYTDPVTTCTNSCSFDITVAPLPVVNAGPDQTLCETETVELDATISEQCNILWTSIDGDGDFSDATIEDPEYTFGGTEILNGSVTLRVLGGACNPCSVGQYDEVTIIIQRSPVADAGEDVTICEDESYTLQGDVTDACGQEWSVSTGDGSFDDATLLNAEFTPGSGSLGLGFAVLTLTAQPCDPCNTSDTDDMVVSFLVNPTVDIDVDNATICENGSYDLEATASSTSSLLWTTTGDGSFSDNTVEDPTYYPGPSDDPSVTLTLTGQPISPCVTEDSDFMTLNIQLLPTVDAGSNATICENGSYTFNDASASEYSGLAWSGGTGSFDNGDQLNATYNAGVGETGNVELTLTAQPVDPCTTAVDDFMTLTINPLPELTSLTLQGAVVDPQPFYFPLTGDLDNGFGMCLDGDENTNYMLDVDALTASEVLETGFMNPFYQTATVPADFFTYWAGRGVVDGAAGWQGIMWSIINGDAPIFYLVYDGSDYALIDGLQYQNDPSQTVPLVLPGNYPKGDYEFTGTIKDVNGCISEDITVGITFGHEAFADAGEDQTVCYGDLDVQLDATVENGCNIQWAPVDGSGSFSDENIEDPIYHPGFLDYVAGSVTLSIQVSACDPCTESAIDQMTIYFSDPPTAEAGDDATICEDASYELYGSVSNACGQSWSSAGDGTFDNAGSLTASYTPGPNDISIGSVQLTLTADACAPCTEPEDDFMTLYIQNAPTVDILVDNIDACEGDVIDFEGLVEYTDKSSVIWFTTNGSNNWDDNEADYPQYTLSQTDAAQEIIYVTVTVIGVDPCSNSYADDNCTITVQLLPIVNAGDDKTVCENGSVDLDDATALEYSSLLWTGTYPDDVFSDPTALNPSYSPGQNAIDFGYSFLTLTAQPLNPCTTVESSSLRVDIQDLPEVNAGDDATICEDGNYTLEGTVEIACGTPSYMWTSDGTGTFDDANSLSAVYTPSEADIIAGSVTLTLTGYPCTPCVDNITDEMVLTIQLLPEVDAGSDADVCESGFYLLEATGANYSSVSWSTDGDGTFDNNLDLNPNYYPGTNDASGGTVTLTVVAYAISPCTLSDSDEITLSVQPLPIADAGDDDTACETGYTFQAGSVAVYNNSNLEWTTNGDGTFDGPTTLLTTYYPGSGDVGAGIVTLTLVANPINPCVISDQDDMDLVILEDAEVNAGDDATICDTDTYELVGATASYEQTLSWETDGDGSFSDPSALNPTYIPGSGDIANGSVELCLNATSVSPCDATPQDCMTLTIQSSPTADAGGDGTLCETGGDVTGTAEFYDTVEWTTDGDGTFDNADQLTATYYPGVNDISGSTVTLTFTAYPIDPCNGEASDDATFTIQKLPVANAGEDKTICETGTKQLNGSVTNACGSLWTSGGDGTFDDATSLTATYTPGTADLAAGNVTLTLTANACGPCDQDDSDDMVLYFQVAPESYAGEDGTFCEDAIFLNDATVANNVSILWTTSGNGTFSNPATLTPQYFPGSLDKTLGQVTLTITATPILPCNVAAKDDIVVTIELNPVVADLDDATICEGETYTIPVGPTPTAENYSSLLWTTTGTGTFDDDGIENPTYTPSQADIDGGAVEICLTAYPIDVCVLEPQECMTLSFQKLPTVDAGDDDTSCGIDPYPLTDATAENYLPGSILWTTSGDGTFSDDTELNPTYYPGPTDKLNLSVTLQVQVSPVSPCAVPPVTDQLVIMIQLKPTVSAGLDGTVCENDGYALDATVANTSGVNWTTGGDGTFNNPALVDATYYPGAEDAAAGTVTLTIEASAISPCTDAVSDDMVLDVQVLPTVDAGSDATICENGSYTFNDASASEYSSLLWTGGSGSFDNADQLGATYNAGAGETGDVQLTLTAEPIDPCTTSVDDFMTLTINPLPELTDLSLQGALAVLPPDYSPLSGNLADGFGMCIDGNEDTHYVLDIDALTATQDLETGYFNEFYHTATVPADFFTYWADRGVVSGATGWQGVMWDIINGDAPIFYLVYDGADYVLIDGLQYQNSGDVVPLILPGNYPQGLYSFSGTIKDVNGCVSEDISVDITFGHAPVANAGDDAEICEDGSYVLSGASVENATGQMWSTSGDGSFDNELELNAEYTPGSQDIEDGSVELCLVAMPTTPCTVNSEEDCMTLTIQKLPEVDAGNDDTTCGLEPFTLSEATAEYYLPGSTLWVTSGDGTFDDATLLNPTYYPGVNDQSNLSVTLTLSVSPVLPCIGQNVQDQLVIYIQLSPTANAGSDATICEDGTHTLSDASVENAGGQYWTTSGDGGFDNDTTLYAVYTPGAQDIEDGSVELCLVAEPKSPCTVESTPDCMTLTIQSLPTADAGADGVVCENASYQIAGASVDNATGQEWSTDGDGSFSNVNDLNPIYYPGTDDIADGSIELCLVATPISPCTVSSDPDCMTLDIQYLPIADAGDDATTCANEPYQLSGSVQYSTNYTWSTSGDGTFDDQGSLTATYYPSADDLNDGNVTLTLTAGAEDPCTGGDVSNMLLTFNPEPAVIFASDGTQFYQDATLTFCFDDVVTITLDEIVSGVAPFDFTWDVYEGGSLVDNGSATGVELDDELFSNTYPAGDYTIELTSMEDANGCSPTDISVYSVNIVVNPQPNPFFTIDGDPLEVAGTYDYCYDVSEVILSLVEMQGGQTSVGTPPFDISFSVNNGTPFNFNGVNYDDEIDLLDYTGTSPGSYAIQVTSLVDANGCAIPESVLNNYYNFTVNIHEEPAIIFAANGNQFYEGATLEYCEGETVTISLDEVLSGTGPFDIAWTVDGTPDNATGVNVGDNLFSGQLAAGTYPIQITSIVDANGCEPADYTPYNATVEVAPPPALIFAANGTPFYEGATMEFCFDENIEVTLDQILLGTAPFTIEWEVNGDPGSASGIDLVNDVLFSDVLPAGTYDVQITSITDANGCSPLDVSMYNATFVVNPQPNPFFTIDDEPLLPGGEFEYCYDVSEVMLALVEEQGGQTTVGTPPFDISFSINNGTPIDFTGVNFGDEINLMDYITGTPGTYDVQVTSVVDDKGCAIPQSVLENYYYFTVIINPEPTLAVTLDGSTPQAVNEYCWDDAFEICLTGVEGTPDWTVEWAVTGPSGSFGDVMTGTSDCFQFNAADYLPGTYDLTIVSLTDADGCATSQATLDTYAFQIEILPEPTLEVTLDGNAPEALNQYCATDQFEICLAGVDGTPDWTVEWAVTGPSGPFGDVMTGTSECFPFNAADYLPGTYDLTIVSLTDANGCAASQATLDSYAFQIEIIPTPTAYAGENTTICEGSELELSTATAENYSSLLWSSNGTGEFDDPLSLNPTYTPGAGDVGNTVTLFLVAQPLAPCTNIASDFVTVYIQPAPYAYAGEDATICEGDDFVLGDADAMNFTSTLWDSDGLGSFDDETMINATYTPDAGDVGNTVTLCLTAEPVNPCELAAESCLSLFIQPAPTAFAGNDATIQSDETYTLSEATATDNDGVLWETSGDGTFDDDGALNPTYTPGIQDMINGEVLLTLNALGVGPCANAVSNMLLTIEGVPPTVEITSPADGTYFNYSPITVTGTASDLDGFVDFVEVRVNGGPWQLATGTDNWTIDVQLDPCFNTIEARATDTQGLQSDIDAVTDIQLEGQQIVMKQGWSYISSYVEATDPNFFTLEDYLVPTNNLVIMLNENGQIFWPSEAINTLGSWDNQFGYKVKSNVDGSWLLAGDKTANQTINLHTGPNIFPVLTNVDYPLPGDFNDDDILIIFELQTARIYWPDGGLYTLSELKPGFGYLGNFYNDFSITYPDYVDCDLKSSSNDVEYVTNVSPWELERTASVHFISITGDAVAALDNAEFIGAFDANGVCIGYADVRQKADNYFLPVYGDESATDWKDGATAGEEISLVAYNGTEEPVVAKYDMSMPNFDGRFAVNGMSRITSFKEGSTGIGNVAVNGMIRLYPNPATSQVNIYYPVSDGFNDPVDVTFTTASGAVVLTQKLTDTESQVDVSNLRPGVYFVKFESKGNTAVKRLVIK